MRDLINLLEEASNDGWVGPGEYKFIDCAGRKYPFMSNYTDYEHFRQYLGVMKPKKVELVRRIVDYTPSEEEILGLYAAIKAGLNAMPDTKYNGKYRTSYKLAAHLGGLNTPSDEEYYEAFEEAYAAFNAGRKSKIPGYTDTYALASQIGKVINQTITYED